MFFNIDVAILAGYEPALAVVEESAAHGKSIAPHGAQETSGAYRSGTSKTV